MSAFDELPEQIAAHAKGAGGARPPRSWLRIALALGLAGGWLFLALHRELLFHAYREEFDERTIYLIFADQMGFAHALLFAIAAVMGLSLQTKLHRFGSIAIGVIAMGLTIALARVGYPHNMVDTFQSMAIRAVIYPLLIAYVSKRFWNVQGPTMRTPFTIADALLMTLAVAVFLAAIRGELNYFRRVSLTDLIYIRNDFASLARFTQEAIVEGVIGLVWIGFLQSRRSLAVSLPSLYCTAFIGSVVSTMGYKAYRLYQYSEPSQIRSIQDLFQIQLPAILAFTTWFCLLGLGLRRAGAISHTSSVSSE